jgi:hypothetical protein
VPYYRQILPVFNLLKHRDGKDIFDDDDEIYSEYWRQDILWVEKLKQYWRVDIGDIGII